MSTAPIPNRSPSIEALRRTDELALAGRLALELMHEINNPLDALGNLTYLAMQEQVETNQVGTYLQQIQEQVNTLKRIVSQTLGLAKSSPVLKEERLNELTQAALRIHGKAIKNRRIHLLPEIPEELSVEVRAGEILQVLSNLIANALDALPEAGTLRLRVRKTSGSVHILVADNGQGIPVEYTESIFEPFFTTKQGRGTGLGLHISKKIIEGHQGRIRMRSSVREGKSGTTFRVSLPILPPKTD
jgi:signal transduction histidine kinase